jgi:hypothetical protein
MNGQQSARRKFLAQATRAGFVVLGSNVALNSCGQNTKRQTPFEGNPCDDIREVSEAELTKRKSFGYVKESPLADNQCSNCNLYLPPKESQSCGECILFKGPVRAEGYCTYWAVKT